VGAGFGDEELLDLVRAVEPLLKVRELSMDEKNELAELFERYRMRLWSKLRRSIGAAFESKLDPDDVLSESYIRAETRWFVRPENPEKHYIWLYGLVHDQLCDMLRRLNAVKRGGQVKHARIPDNSAVEIALELCQSRTGASTFAARNEFMARVRKFLERDDIKPIDREIFSMRVFDRLSYPDIVVELSRRAKQRTSGDPGTVEIDGPKAETDAGPDPLSADAISRRFTRMMKRLMTAILTEFPELLDALPSLWPGKSPLAPGGSADVPPLDRRGDGTGPHS
jgi:DNA-directed RNA polymerase specialized sigma24 family protein